MSEIEKLKVTYFKYYEIKNKDNEYNSNVFLFGDTDEISNFYELINKDQDFIIDSKDTAMLIIVSHIGPKIKSGEIIVMVEQF